MKGVSGQKCNEEAGEKKEWKSAREKQQKTSEERANKLNKREVCEEKREKRKWIEVQ